MKKNDWLILGGAALVGFYLYSKAEKKADDILGAPGQIIQNIEKWFSEKTERIIPDATKGIMETTGTVVGTAFSGQFGQTGYSTPQQTAAFSEVFNKYVGGGVQFTSPNQAGTAVLLNPNLTPTGVQTVQSALTKTAISSGAGVASIINWEKTQNIGGLAFPTAGGVATNYAALAAATPSASYAAAAAPRTSSTPTAQLASAMSRGLY